MQVTTDIERGLYNLLGLKIVARIEVNYPLVGQLEVAIDVQGIQADLVRIAHGALVDGLGAVFTYIEARTEVDRPLDVGLLVAITIGSRLHLTLGLRHAVVKVGVILPVRRIVVTPPVFIFILVFLTEQFLDSLVVEGIVKRSAITLETSKAPIRPLRAITHHHITVLVKLVGIGSKRGTHAERIVLGESHTQVHRQVAPRSLLGSKVI